MSTKTTTDTANNWSNSNNTTASSSTSNTYTCPYSWEMPRPPKGEVGWICPKCGRGMAPWRSYCDCESKWTVTCGTNTIPNDCVTLGSTIIGNGPGLEVHLKS